MPTLEVAIGPLPRSAEPCRRPCRLLLPGIALNRRGRSSDPKRDAAVGFAKKLIEWHGKVSDVDLAGMRAAGFSDPQIVEVVALSAQFLLTNFINNVADTDIDFPGVEAAQRAA